MNTPLLAFKPEQITLPLAKLCPIRPLPEPEKRKPRYNAILSSIKETGLVEPLAVYPQKGGLYSIMDGHFRYYALKTLGHKTALCIIALEDESFTYNARVNRLNPMQEYNMLLKAISHGVPRERLAKTLNLSLSTIGERVNMLNGIAKPAIELLSKSPITPAALRIMKKVTAERQIEMAQLMADVSNYTNSYAEILYIATPKEQLLHPEKPKTKDQLSLQEIARFEHESKAVEQNFRAVQDAYGANMIRFTFLRGHLKKLFEHGKIVQFLTREYPELWRQFDYITSTNHMFDDNPGR